MATINEIIQSAVDRVKLKGSETWIKWSFWTRAKDVELNSGKNVETAVSELDENISNEIDRATDRENEIETALNSEITRAKSAESTLSTSINNEITRAKNAESTLETNKVPITRTINGKALSSDITLSASDVGADASGSANTALTNAKAYTDTKVADLVGTAPETLDTLEELADALKDNADIVDVLNESITSKASEVDLTSHMSNNTAHITADERTAWNDANNKKHEHTNKTILDNTTASYTTEEKEKLSGIKDGAESTATTTSGSNPTVTNSADAQLIYGKIAGYTVQDGVPTSDSPIDIQGLGDSGSVEVKTCGKNLLNYSEWAKVGMPYGTSVFENNGVTITATRDDTYTDYQSDKFPEEARVYVEEGKSYTLSWEESTNQSGLVFIFPNGLINNMRSVNNSTKKSLTYTANNDVSFITFRFGAAISGTTISYKNIQIEENVVATDFEPYTETTAIIPLDLPLYDGDYIEVYADGSGKLVRVNKELEITSWEDIYSNDLTNTRELRSIRLTDRKNAPFKCTTACYVDTTWNVDTPHICSWGNIVADQICVRIPINSSIEDYTCKVVYKLATPVETELNAEQVTQFKKLYTFDNVTNFFCDGEITARYYVNTDSGDTVGMMQKSISKLQEVGSESSIGLTKLYTEVGANTDGSMTQSAITTAINNAKSAAAQTVDINEINESTLMTYYVPFTAIGKAYELKANDGIRYIHQQGSGSSTNGAQIGSAILQLGNSSYSNTSGNKQGILRLYSHLGAYVDLKTEPVSPSASYTLKLPGASGTLATEDKVNTKLSSYLPLAGGDMNGVLKTQNLIPNNDYRLVGNNTNPYYYGYFKNMYSNNFNITDSSNNSLASISYSQAIDTMYYSANNVNAPFSDVVGLSISSGMYHNMRLYGQNIRLESKNYISSNTTIAMASDEKVKSFTEDIAIDEEKLVKLFDIIKPKSYNYKYLKSDSVNIGFSAQEIEQAMIDLDIDPEKYGILNIQYNHIVSRGSDFEDGKYYTKFYEISYNDLFNLSLLKTHMMEKEHVERLAALEEKASKLDELEARLSALENK